MKFRRRSIARRLSCVVCLLLALIFVGLLFRHELLYMFLNVDFYFTLDTGLPSLASVLPIGFLMTPVLHTSDSESILFFVTCQAKDMTLRKAVRNTWARSETFDSFHVIFVIGNSEWGLKNNRRLEAEQSEFGDLLQGDFTDSYFNLTLKTLLILQFSVQASTNHNIKYLIKSDIDTVPYLHNINMVINSVVRDDAIFGKRFLIAKPKSNKRHKNYIPNYTGRHLPPYCSGSLRAFTTVTAGKLLVESKRHSYFKIPEDIFTAGVLPYHCGTELIDVPGIFASIDEACIAEQKTPVVPISVHLGSRGTFTDIHKMYQIWDEQKSICLT